MLNIDAATGANPPAPRIPSRTSIRAAGSPRPCRKQEGWKDAEAGEFNFEVTRNWPCNSS